MKFLTALNVTIVSLLGVGLTSCATTQKSPTIVLSSLQFKCKTEPRVPPADMSDAELMVYITRLQNAGEDCRDQLAEVKNSLELQDGITITDVLVVDQKDTKPWWDLF